VWLICHGCLGKIPRAELPRPERVDSSQRQTLALSPFSNAYGGVVVRTLRLSTAAAVGAAEPLSFLAMSFDRAAGDETVPLHQRVEFARRANWLRIDARLTQMGSEGLATGMIAAASRPLDALSSSFKLALLLRHYGTQTSNVSKRK
jgi:hypothetical protein